MNTILKDLKPTAIRFSLMGTILIIDGEKFILREDKSDPVPVTASSKDFSNYILVVSDKECRWIANDDGRFDMTYIKEEHRKNMLIWSALRAIIEACDGKEAMRWENLVYLNTILNKKNDDCRIIDSYLRINLKPSMLPLGMDIDGAIELARKNGLLEAFEILEDRIRKILPKEEGQKKE